MSVLEYAVQVGCDLCDAVAMCPPLKPGERVDYLNPSLPEGWAAFVDLRLRDLFGGEVRQLCPACSAMNVGQLAAKMRERVVKVS